MFRIFFAGLADQHQLITLHVGTVFEITRFATAVRALANRFCVVAEINCHTLIKHSQRTFPQSVVTVLFTVFHNPAVDLVNFFEPTLLHHGRYHFAANSTGTITNDLLIFYVVVLVAFEFGDKVSRCIGIWYDSIFEFTDTCFMLVASVKKHYVVTVFFHHLVDFMRLQVFAAAYYAVHIDIKFIIAVFKSHEFAARFDAHARKVVTRAIAPFPHDVRKRRILLAGLYVRFAGLNTAPNRTINSMSANDNSPF